MFLESVFSISTSLLKDHYCRYFQCSSDKGESIYNGPLDTAWLDLSQALQFVSLPLCSLCLDAHHSSSYAFLVAPSFFFHSINQWLLPCHFFFLSCLSLVPFPLLPVLQIVFYFEEGVLEVQVQPVLSAHGFEQSSFIKHGTVNIVHNYSIIVSFHSKCKIVSTITAGSTIPDPKSIINEFQLNGFKEILFEMQIWNAFFPLKVTDLSILIACIRVCMLVQLVSFK